MRTVRKTDTRVGGILDPNQPKVSLDYPEQISFWIHVWIWLLSKDIIDFWPSMSGKKSPKWCFGKMFLFQRINQFSDLKLSTFWPIWVQNKSKYSLRVKICTEIRRFQQKCLQSKPSMIPQRPNYLNLPYHWISPSKIHLLRMHRIRIFAIYAFFLYHFSIAESAQTTDPNQLVINAVCRHCRLSR
jgi:hypothetical protein